MTELNISFSIVEPPSVVSDLIVPDSTIVPDTIVPDTNDSTISINNSALISHHIPLAASEPATIPVINTAILLANSVADFESLPPIISSNALLMVLISNVATTYMKRQNAAASQARDGFAIE